MGHHDKFEAILRIKKLAAFAERWSDEREYEDIAEYQKAVQALLPEGAVIERMSKRPFGFEVNIDGHVYRVAVKLLAKSIVVEGEHIMERKQADDVLSMVREIAAGAPTYRVDLHRNPGLCEGSDRHALIQTLMLSGVEDGFTMEEMKMIAPIAAIRYLVKRNIIMKA